MTRRRATGVQRYWTKSGLGSCLLPRATENLAEKTAGRPVDISEAAKASKERAMDLKIPHNYFTLWMVTPSRNLAGSRLVDLLDKQPSSLFGALGSFARR